MWKLLEFYGLSDRGRTFLLVNIQECFHRLIGKSVHVAHKPCNHKHLSENLSGHFYLIFHPPASLCFLWTPPPHHHHPFYFLSNPLREVKIGHTFPPSIPALMGTNTHAWSAQVLTPSLSEPSANARGKSHSSSSPQLGIPDLMDTQTVDEVPPW